MSDLITCRELIDLLDDYVAGAQTPVVRAEFERHLAVCRACRDYLQTYRETIRLSRAAMGADDAPAPDGVPPALLKAILAARERKL